MIIFSKSLLRHPLTRSTIAEITGDSTFQPVLNDPKQPTVDSTEAISRVILCTGQIYAALHQHRTSFGIEDTAIIRIEELHPFPWTEVKRHLDMYPNAKSIVWAQEEHYNGGAWHYVRDRISTVMKMSRYHASQSVLYAGRGPSPTTATGLKHVHEAESAQLLRDAFSVTT